MNYPPEVESKVLMPISFLPPKAAFQKPISNFFSWLSDTTQDLVRRSPDAKKVPYLAPPKGALQFLEPWVISLFLLPSILRYRFGGKIQLIHAHFAFPDGVVGMRVAKFLSVPYVVTIHGSDINLLENEPPRVRKQVLLALNNAKLTIAVSDALRKKAIDLGVSEDNLTVIPNGVDIRKFYPSVEAKNAGTKQLLLIGTLRPIKGIDVLLRSVARLIELGERNFHLSIIGDGTLKNDLISLAHELRVEKYVSFVGSVKHEEIPNWLRGADLLVISSRNEGWPTVINEAFACATPIVSTDVGGIAEAIPRRELGILVEKENVEQLATAIRSAIAEPWNSETLVQQASQYSWQKIAHLLVENYKTILATERSR